MNPTKIELELVIMQITDKEWELINNGRLLIVHSHINDSINHLENCLIEFQVNYKKKGSFVAKHYELTFNDLFEGLQDSFNILDKNKDKTEIRIELLNNILERSLVPNDETKLHQYRLLDKINIECEKEGNQNNE